MMEKESLEAHIKSLQARAIQTLEKVEERASVPALPPPPSSSPPPSPATASAAPTLDHTLPGQRVRRSKPFGGELMRISGLAASPARSSTHGQRKQRLPSKEAILATGSAIARAFGKGSKGVTQEEYEAYGEAREREAET